VCNVKQFARAVKDRAVIAISAGALDRAEN